jgi:DNA-binding protein H-NS
MKNPWMRAWLQAMNNTLSTTQTFWTELMRWQTRAAKPNSSKDTEPELPLEAESVSAPTPATKKPENGQIPPPATSASSEPTSPPRSDAKAPATAPKEAAATKRKAASTRSAKPKKKAAPKATADDSAAAKARTGTSAPKFQHPTDRGLTWSGRGRRPRWITDALETGRTLDDLRVRER